MPKFGIDNESDPAVAVYAVTKANSPLPNGTCRALLVGTAGTANIVDSSGNLCTNIPLQAGYNPIGCRQVRIGGNADNIWALY